MSRASRLNDAQRAIVERKQGQAKRALGLFADWCTGGTAASEAIAEDVDAAARLGDAAADARRAIGEGDDGEGAALVVEEDKDELAAEERRHAAAVARLRLRGRR